jgi:L-iditol 2-dehydrogenase
MLTAPHTLELQEVEAAPRTGELLVRVSAALTCGTDTKMYLRGHAKFPFPSRFGHELSGTVEEVGVGVKGFSAGDNIMVPVSAPCGACAACRRGLECQCETLFEDKVWGAFARYCIIPARVAERSTFPKPDHLPFAEAALLDPLASVVHAYEHCLVAPGASVLVLGGGPMGFLHAVVGRKRGMQVSVADPRRDRLDIFSAAGFSVVPVEKGWEGSFVRSFNLVMECSGAVEAFDAACAVLAPGGTLCLFAGLPVGQKLTFDGAALHYLQQKIVGSFHYGRRAVAEAYVLLCARELPLGPLFSGTYPLERFPEVMEKVLKGEGLKYIIEP